MKKNALLAVAMLLPFFLFCQTPFLPLGAKWGGVVQCVPTWAQCGPGYPHYYTFEVTEDTVIQGKYCTLVKEQDWFTLDEKTIVHQDGHQIYRYDRETGEFKLALDFSKEVGESWQIEVPDFWYASGIFTITVAEKDGPYRRVLINDVLDLPLYEGFGGIVFNKRLLLGLEFFIFIDPMIWDELTCYIDPVEGLLFGNAVGCQPTHTSNPSVEKAGFVVYPNPASMHIILDCKYPPAKAAEWSLSDVWGRVVKRQQLAPGTGPITMWIDNLPGGLYFWSVYSEGIVTGVGKVVVVRN